MTARSIITCDNQACGKDLTESEDKKKAFRLVLAPQSIPAKDGTSQMHAEPRLQFEHHFCGFTCVADFATRQANHEAEEAKAAADAGALRDAETRIG